MSSPAQNPSHFSHLEAWLRSYDPASLFDDEGALMPELKGECLKKIYDSILPEIRARWFLLTLRSNFNYS